MISESLKINKTLTKLNLYGDEIWNENDDWMEHFQEWEWEWIEYE